jgi:hypothetical protein
MIPRTGKLWNKETADSTFGGEVALYLSGGFVALHIDLQLVRDFSIIGTATDVIDILAARIIVAIAILLKVQFRQERVSAMDRTRFPCLHTHAQSALISVGTTVGLTKSSNLPRAPGRLGDTELRSLDRTRLSNLIHARASM